jgi:FixJ family two-component response regulator
VAEARQTLAVIDDDASVRRALCRLLRAAGWDVTTFATAEEFLQAPAQPAPVCLILDLHLPGMSGLELQERLRAEGRKIPIICVTAYEDEQAREQARRGGAVAFLKKPFEEACLLDALQRAAGN